MLHRDVHLRLRWNDNRPSDDHPENGKEKFHPMFNRDLSASTDAALQEVALKISEPLATQFAPQPPAVAYLFSFSGRSFWPGFHA